MRDSKDLQHDVLDELQWEPSLDAEEIGVTARDGVVTLKGSVATYIEKLTAERVVKRVLGVRAVANDLEVRISGHAEHTDTDIAQAGINALMWRTSVPDDRIKLTVRNGWVILEGEVDWFFQSESAEEAVRPLLGVRGVINHITVKPRVSATDVKTRIEAAFKRSAELDANKVRVEAHDGEVTLKGDVHSWSERQQAEQTAWSASGVKRVENLITISPYAP
ncbi:BON domain-containing protein [Singulisphaera sp. PoT]|uniref:BON domain-containing protein n=1 Tax=Singulisphaera sp. PoT TaxID=3411797 RepID=UPI003BF4C61E